VNIAVLGSFRRVFNAVVLGLGLSSVAPAFAQPGSAGGSATPPVPTVTATSTVTTTAPPAPKPPAPKAPVTVRPVAKPAPAPPSAKPSAAPPPAASAAPAASGAPSASAAPLTSAEPAPSAEPPVAASASVEPAPSAAPSAVAPPVVVPPAPPPTPASSAPAESVPIGPGSPVNLGDEQVFSLRKPRGGKSAVLRAADASRALTTASHQKNPGDVRWERRGDVAVVLVGQTPIVQLVLEDAVAAGDTSLDVHAASVTAAVREAIASEQRRSALAKLVFSISLLVFFGLIVFYLVRKVGEFADRARVWIDTHGERVLAVRVRQIEVVSPGTVKSTALIGLTVGRWVAQLGIVYAWLVVVLSMFDATRGYTEKLTGFVVSPLSQLMTRLVSGLPVLVVLVIAGFAVFVLVRFVGLFFDAIARGETAVTGVPRDLAAPTSALVRFGLVLSALIFLAPIVTGSIEGPVGRSGSVLFAALGLSAVPFLANGFLGAVTVFGRRLRPGQHVQIGTFAGRIASIGLLEVRLEDLDRSEVRVPHLYLLRYPTRVLGLRAPIALDVAVASGARHAEVRELLKKTASSFDHDARVELVAADVGGARYRLLLSCDRSGARSELQLAVVEALAEANVPLGRLEP
jgi:small-conductance mechanosensitive channel